MQMCTERQSSFPPPPSNCRDGFFFSTSEANVNCTGWSVLIEGTFIGPKIIASLNALKISAANIVSANLIELIGKYNYTQTLKGEPGSVWEFQTIFTALSTTRSDDEFNRCWFKTGDFQEIFSNEKSDCERGGAPERLHWATGVVVMSLDHLTFAGQFMAVMDD